VSSGNVPDRLPPLPVRPRPAAGEPAGAYIRRLARANHLRPSYLHGYLAGPPGYRGPVQPERLAALSGRTVAVLEGTLTGLRAQARDTAWQPPQLSRSRVRAAKPALFAAIRRDAQDGYSIQALAARHRVHRHMVRQALADPAPPPRKQPPPRATAIGHLHGQITAMLACEPQLTVRQIWERLLDDHDADIPYATVCYHVISLQPGPRKHGRPATASQPARSTETTPPNATPAATRPQHRTSDAGVSHKIARPGQAITTGNVY